MDKKIKIIAHIFTDFPEKFGIPRQSLLVKGLKGKIVFEKEYRDINALRGIEDFSHLWLLWLFEEVKEEGFSPLVRPPRLGGNEKKGVFASRSPFRPNPIGLSSVKLEGVENTKDGPVIWVSGIDLRNNTPIIDIKPYLKFADSHPEAEDGFAKKVMEDNLEVDFPRDLLLQIPEDKQEALIGILRLDPRPHYQDDPERVYGMSFGGFNIKFKVIKKLLRVMEIEDLRK